MVKVRALEWSPLNDQGFEMYHAHAAFGWYGIFVDEDSAAGAIIVEWAPNIHDFGMVYALTVGRAYTWDDAKEMAQAEYEASVTSALEEE